MRGGLPRRTPFADRRATSAAYPPQGRWHGYARRAATLPTAGARLDGAPRGDSAARCWSQTRHVAALDATLRGFVVFLPSRAIRNNGVGKTRKRWRPQPPFAQRTGEPRRGRTMSDDDLYRWLNARLHWRGRERVVFAVNHKHGTYPLKTRTTDGLPTKKRKSAIEPFTPRT